MDLLRRNSDYALRLMVNLAVRNGKTLVSASVLAQEEDVPAALTSKLLQKLKGAGLVKSTMGVQGGFALSKQPEVISLLEIIELIQGRIAINRCLLNKASCPRSGTCPITAKLGGLQEHLVESLNNVKLGDLVSDAPEATVEDDDSNI